MRSIFTAVMLLLTSASCVTAEEWSAERQRGWCEGYTAAVEASQRNRDHYRALTNYPAETLEQSMARIHAAWPPVAPSGFKPSSDIIDSMTHLEMAGIDLYVVLPGLFFMDGKSSYIIVETGHGESVRVICTKDNK